MWTFDGIGTQPLDLHSSVHSLDTLFFPSHDMQPLKAKVHYHRFRVAELRIVIVIPRNRFVLEQA